MRLALLGDIHGNSLALDAVLADIRAQGEVDGYWLLGDYAAIGYDPAGVLERLAGLPNARFIRGNTDRYTAAAELPESANAQAAADPHRLPAFISTVRSFAWTAGALAATGWLDWLAGLPLDGRFTLPSGERVLCVHASPGTDDGDGIPPNVSETELQTTLAGSEAEVIFVGHTHRRIDRQAGSARVINPGSVSNPYPPDLRASYGLLTAEPGGYTYEQRLVDYDRQAVIAAVQRVRHPAADYLIKFMRGEN